LDREHQPEFVRNLRRMYALGQGRSLPGRERLRHLLERAGNPQLAVPAVLVGGTNGKGRLTTALSAALSTQYRTGAFIKPHLKSIRERWRINDEAISEEQFAQSAGQALDLIEQHARETGEPISFFEACVLLGALLFQAEKCEIAIWEVGLGGKEDACNLCDPLLSIITNVQLDHQAILGHSLEEIAADKAWIGRPGRPLLLGPPRRGWEADYERYAPVVRAVAEEIGADLIEVAQSSIQLRDLLGEAEPGIGSRQLPEDTTAIAVVAAKYLYEAGFPVPFRQFSAGLRRARYRGRMERTELEGRPVLIDAAHNRDSLRWLAQVLENEGGRRAGFPLIFGCQSSRDPAQMLAPLTGLVSALVPIAVPVLHPCPVEAILSAADGMPVSLPAGITTALPGQDLPLDHVTELDPPDNSTGWVESVRHGLSLATPDRPAVICGSIYYIGEILRAFEDGWV